MRRWIEVIVLLAILAGGLWLRWTPLPLVEDLRPHPDALEYEEAARNLIGGEGYCLVVEGGRYPPRYPFGFSLLLAPLLLVADRGPGSGVAVVIATALLAVVACWRLGHRAGGPVAGAAAAALIAVAPAHVRWSRQVMSDVPAATAVAWLAVAMLGARARGVGAWAAVGAGIGLAATVRTTNLLVVVPALLVVTSAHSGMRQRAARIAALGTGLVVGLVPALLYGIARFGHPLRSGYDFWAPEPYFSLRFALDAPKGGGPEPNLWHYLRALGGFGTLYTWPIAALAVSGCVVGWRRGGYSRDLVTVALALLVTILGTQTFFFWQDARFLLPVAPLVLAVAALPLGAAANPGLRIAAVALVVWGVTLMARSPRLYAPDRVVHETSELRALDRELPANAAVLMSTDESLFRRLLRRPGSDRVWVPLALDQHQLAIRWHRLAPYAPATDDGKWIRRGLVHAARTVDALLDEGRPVYLHARNVPAGAALFAELARGFRVEAKGNRLFRIERQTLPGR